MVREQEHVCRRHTLKLWPREERNENRLGLDTLDSGVCQREAPPAAAMVSALDSGSHAAHSLHTLRP